MCGPVKRMSFHLTDCIHPHRLVSFRKVINTSRAYTVLNAQIYIYFFCRRQYSRCTFSSFIFYCMRFVITWCTHIQDQRQHISQKSAILISDIFASELHHRFSDSHMWRWSEICTNQLRSVVVSVDVFNLYRYTSMIWWVCARIFTTQTHTHTHSAPNLFVFHMCLLVGIWVGYSRVNGAATGAACLIPFHMIWRRAFLCCLQIKTNALMQLHIRDFPRIWRGWWHMNEMEIHIFLKFHL